MSLDLTAKHFTTPWFDVLHVGKAKTRVISCHLNEEQLILADCVGNVWSVDAVTEKSNGRPSISTASTSAFT